MLAYVQHAQSVRSIGTKVINSRDKRIEKIFGVQWTQNKIEPQKVSETNFERKPKQVDEYETYYLLFLFSKR